MKRKSYNEMPCPIAQCLEHVGEWWSILIIRDLFRGIRRFDELTKSLGIAPNILTRRLNDLVESGILERQKYGESDKRFEYVLTQRGMDLAPILILMFEWGNKHSAPKGVKSYFINIKTKEIAEPVVIDRKTGEAMSHETYQVHFSGDDNE
ncbi:Transcriptional regulator, HxlR family (fragment) [Sulfurovum sp. enrichment culture clone C5]|uniref:Transcriptional regulator, HxlR family n=1 Tax=Sulfurovum sp. enrichment culture clone C5 TaxID=497650 RepID=A0A0S4XP38_9BACT